jgi:SAM-dependent methyltransferase
MVMEQFGLPRSDEPFDFRRQAATYGRFRRDYSAALYDAIAAHAGAAAGRWAVDVGCGTGFVTSSLAARGWRAMGVDFSAPMLAATAGAGGPRGFVRARAEALPIREGRAALLTCGTAFHWFAPAPTLAEFARALAPGGWAALFWRYAMPTEPYMTLVAEVCARFGRALPQGEVHVHPPAPFDGSGLDALPVRVIESVLAFTPDEFHGYISTVETIRRIMGDAHAAFLDALAVDLRRRWPEGFRERNQEYLFLGQKPA